MKRHTLLLGLASMLFLLPLLLLLVGVNMRRGLNHDEYQFVASGQLLASAGLLPYRDFPYFHVPGLSLIYAALFQVSPQLLLSARLFSVLCGWLLVVLLWGVTLVELRQERLWVKLAAASGVGLLLIASPIFIYTSGRAWNHDLPMLLTLIAWWIFDRYGQRRDDRPEGAPPRFPALAVCGLLLGLATATRLSFAFAALALLVALLVQPKQSWQARWHGLRSFITGGVVGALPAWIFLLWTPQPFLFGNLTYIGLNTQYYHKLAMPPQSMTLLGKAEFFSGLLRNEPANGLPLLSLLVVALACGWRGARQPVAWQRLQPWAILFLSMFLSALVATPSQTQYFYPLWPLLLFAIVLLLKETSPISKLPIILLFVSGVIAIFLSRSPYQAGLEIVFSPREWYPTKLHARGQYVRTLVQARDGQPGDVLTVAPLMPLEGGVAIYPELATGPFAWRVAPLLSVAERRRYHLFTPDELMAQITATPPRALLVGLENDDVDLEAGLVIWAQQQGYMPIGLPDEGTLWVSPLAEWDGAIRLGAHTLPHMLRPGEDAEVVFYLQNIRPIPVNLNLLVRLVGADGQEYWRAEGWPWGAATSNWQAGEVWPDGHPLTVPANAPQGCYRVELSFYNPETFDPLGSTVDAGHLLVSDQPGASTPCP